MKVTDNNYDQYRITYSDGTIVTVPSGSLAKDNHSFASSGNKSISVKGINLQAKDNCFPSLQPFNAVVNIPSSSITSLNSISPNEIELNYTLPTNVLGRIEIASNNNTTFQQIKPAYKDSRDTIRSVNNETSFYCFRIGTVDACTNAIAYPSFSVCSILLNTVAKDGFNQLDWITNSVGIINYSVRRDAQSGYTSATPPSISLNDLNIECNIDYCYQLSANYAGAISTSLPKCVTSFTTAKPPALTDVLASFNTNNQVEVEWTDALSAVEYSIFKNINKESYFLTTVQPESPYVDSSFDLNSPLATR